MIQNLDPRVKISLVSLFSVLIIIIDKLPAAAVMAFVFLIVRFAAKIPFNGKSIRALVVMTVFIIILQTLFNPGKNYILNPIFPLSFPFFGGTGSLKWEGLLLGLVISCRLTALMLLLPVFTETTDPYQISQGLTRLGLNYRIAFVISAAFNLIPLYKDEALSVIEAQKLRGISTFEKGSFYAKMKTYPALVIPLVLTAMRKASLTGIAMDSRAFGAYKSRTWCENISLKIQDYITCAISLVFMVFMLWFNFYM
jgi:energy-coupling factor transport system permease protein